MVRTTQNTRPHSGPAPRPRSDAQPTRSLTEKIRARAYEIYVERTRAGTPGDPVSDWLQAERETASGARASSESREAAFPTSPSSRIRGETLLHEDEDA